jgi:hypothetical protein
MFHYFLTGDRASRDAAVGLGQWVLDMDDGGLTPWRWLAAGPTGLASQTRGEYGPGRGAGHSILACLVAHRLTREARYLKKAEDLIKRTVHPRDDVAGRDLLDAEQRWSYTVFLQAVGAFLQWKAECGEVDESYGYARLSLLHYARWMLVHERPYLDHPEGLEYPTETWAAQDMRKADVFLWAALHAEGTERQSFLERARWFFNYAVATLTASATRYYTRPLVLLLANGTRHAWFAEHAGDLPEPPSRSDVPSLPAPSPFEPQKTRAIRRARWIIAIGLAAAILSGVASVML